MRKRKPPKSRIAYKIAKIGKRLGTVYGETEKEALANAQKNSLRPRRSANASTCGAND